MTPVQKLDLLSVDDDSSFILMIKIDGRSTFLSTKVIRTLFTIIRRHKRRYKQQQKL